MSGGGGVGFSFYGVLRDSCKAGFWDPSNIQTMHATSAGSIIMMSIPIIKLIGWDSYDDFLIKRPWEKMFELTADRVFNSYNNIGFFDRDVFQTALQPLLSAVDLPLNATLQEFYEFSGIDMHWYTTNLDEYKLEDVSHKTHPNWTIIDATYCSAALPIMFRPGNVNGVYYSDGGTFCAYPIMRCLPLAENPDEIFGLYKNNDAFLRGNIKHVDYNNILDYLSDLTLKTIDLLGSEEKTQIKHSVCIQDANTNVSELISTFKTSESRRAKIRKGETAWNEFAAKLGGP